MHWFQVFVAMNLTTYGMNVDMLDVHAVSRYLVTSLSADDDEDDMSFQITQKIISLVNICFFKMTFFK